MGRGGGEEGKGQLFSREGIAIQSHNTRKSKIKSSWESLRLHRCRYRPPPSQKLLVSPSPS